MTFSNKDQFDALIKLAEFKREVREGRRQFEWKFTGLALIALAGLSVVPTNTRWYIVAFAVVGILILHTWWVIFNNTRTERDRAAMYHYKDLAEKLLPEKKRLNDVNFSSAPLSFCQQPFAIIQILTAYGVGCFAVAVRYFAIPMWACF